MVVRIGTSGWSYDHWTGVLYPPKLAATRRLAVYVEEFDTVELNASFYRWPTPARFTQWRDQLPDGFTMTVKAPRGLTHARRLGSPEQWIERIAAGWDALGNRRAALLVQLHPAQQRDDERLDHFLSAVPDSIPVAMELRHPSWDDPAVYDLLRGHGAAYVVMSGPGLPCVVTATAGLAYLRLHGPGEEAMYSGSYDTEELRRWAREIRAWDAEGRDVLVYFNNDLGGHAVRNAQELRSMLV
ncbi:MAG: DUF72 domain-containing protein [Mycolicibacterium neoaurum]|uniref:Sensor histidine kinase n=1 Tax=Mycolicibacterium neoaurum TaxID=1795 RepID=A0AAV2WNN9_MYCNE|nr:DUF72 domain-containing protein [Mycolicibacterium neoaurum]TLH57914.1 DUF72 domain-containing protein [Mycolicibacterium neoaurum]CDQ45702.1 hypothetical protein BN1047_03602 [Mycolicibacterium neoaurum]